MSAPSRSKTYYENHKDEIINKNKEYKKRIMYIKFFLKKEIIF